MRGEAQVDERELLGLADRTTETCRPLSLIGKAVADGWLEPGSTEGRSRRSDGSSGRSTRAPCPSIAKLCALVRLVQMASSPHATEGFGMNAGTGGVFGS